MRAVVVLMLLVAVAAAAGATLPDELIEEWNAFKLKYQKSYQDEAEEKYRMKIFAETRHTINEHNKRYERGEVTYTMGINKFADLQYEELMNMMTGLNKNATNLRDVEGADIKGATFIPSEYVTIPDNVDWRKKGAVTPVKSQGFCGSCWAFSVTGATEGQHFRKTQKLVSLSEQNLVDCVKENGCGGAWPEQAFQYIITNHGIDTEQSYGYEDRNETCRYRADSVGATISSYTYVEKGNENTLAQAVATVGPVSVCINTPASFFAYNNGTYHDPKCSSTPLGHAVLVVGFGTDENGSDYWIVKNSWGADWGLDGYIWMARNKGDLCGIATHAIYPNV